MKKFEYKILVFICCILLMGCFPISEDDVIEVDFSEENEEKQFSELKNKGLPVLKIAVAPVISPKESFVYYKELFDYIGGKLQMRIEFRQRTSYEAVNELLERNLVDIAFICTGAYVAGYDSFDLLVAPLRDNEPYYQGYIITNKLSGIEEFEDFEGRSFAYTDPLSNTGKLIVKKRLSDMGVDPESFFGNTILTMSHDLSIQMIARNMVDGAAVSSLIFDYMQKYHPEIVKNIYVIEKSDKYGIPPVVSAPLIDVVLRDEIESLFLGMHEHERGRDILNKLLIDRFVIVDDSIYNSVKALSNNIW